ncbi:MAG: hypothetical protein ACLP8S_34390 [Solirubrobacteraceae bacterium]
MKSSTGVMTFSQSARSFSPRWIIAALAGTIEGEHVVAARQRRGTVEEVQLLRRSVVAPSEDDRRPGTIILAGTEEVPREGEVSIRRWDFDDLGRRLHQCGPQRNVSV